jgi:hypothetical protein
LVLPQAGINGPPLRPALAASGHPASSQQRLVKIFECLFDGMHPIGFRFRPPLEIGLKVKQSCAGHRGILPFDPGADIGSPQKIFRSTGQQAFQMWSLQSYSSAS